MSRLQAVLIVASLLIPAAVQAAPESISLHANNAGELADLCGANPNQSAADAKINFCHGYAQGMLDAVKKRAQEAKKFCFPPNAPSRAVVMGEFVNWVRAMPDHRNQTAFDGLTNFFGERFPCK
jgi:hypothetical protein